MRIRPVLIEARWGQRLDVQIRKRKKPGQFTFQFFGLVLFFVLFLLMNPAEPIVFLFPADLVSSLNMIYLLAIISVSCALTSN